MTHVIYTNPNEPDWSLVLGGQEAAPEWELHITFRNKGTRSEGRFGVLYQMGERVRSRADARNETLDTTLDTTLGTLRDYGPLTQTTLPFVPTGWDFADSSRMRASWSISAPPPHTAPQLLVLLDEIVAALTRFDTLLHAEDRGFQTQARSDMDATERRIRRAMLHLPDEVRRSCFQLDQALAMDEPLADRYKTHLHQTSQVRAQILATL